MIILPPYIPPPPTEEARELGRKVTDLLLLAREADPNLGMQDISQSLRIAEASLRSELGAGNSQASKIALAAAGLLAMAVLGAFAYLYTGSAPGANIPSIALLIGGGVIVLVLLVVFMALRK